VGLEVEASQDLEEVMVAAKAGRHQQSVATEAYCSGSLPASHGYTHRNVLISGFYKAVTIRDPNVSSAIQEMMKRDNRTSVRSYSRMRQQIRTSLSMDDVHDVGTFAQITSAFPVHGEENSLTAVLYPHRRIKMSAGFPAEDQRIR
jgi:ATP-dependent Lon protease